MFEPTVRHHIKSANSTQTAKQIDHKTPRPQKTQKKHTFRGIMCPKSSLYVESESAILSI